MSNITLEIAKLRWPDKKIEVVSHKQVNVTLKSLPLEDLILAYKPISDSLVGRSQLMELTMDLIIASNGKLSLKPQHKHRESYAKLICESWLAIQKEGAIRYAS